jgi:hypothetical protein
LELTGTKPIKTGKNPYESQTPEWHLYELMDSANHQASAWSDDAERFLKKAYDAKEKARGFKETLDKLTKDN